MLSTYVSIGPSTNNAMFLTPEYPNAYTLGLRNTNDSNRDNYLFPIQQ